MEWNPPDTWRRMAEWLRGLDAAVAASETPRALLVVSAHWEEKLPTVTTSPAPPLLFDYSGFPPHTYQLKWPAPGSPELAAEVRGLLKNAGIESREDADRGYDHGVFVPLLLSYPDARLPTVQLSLRAGLDPAAHLAMGRALRPLREKGVLIVGSGMSYHNMQRFMTGGALPDSERFDDWLAKVSAEPESREAELQAWTKAPSARECHPREEHLLPLMVAAGAADGERGQVVFRDQVMGSVVSAVQFG